MGKQPSNKIDLGTMLGPARIILKSGVMRAGIIQTAWEDAIMVEDETKQMGIIFRDAIAELWEGYGEQSGEVKEDGGA